MPTYDEILVFILFIIMLFWEYRRGEYHNNPRSLQEWFIDAMGLIQLVIIKPMVMIAAFAVGLALLPEQQNSLQDIPFWLGFALVFLPDDFSHYWVHRLAHDHPFLWGAHRTHHTPTVYQTSIAFRENWLWYVIMPGFWWTGLMVYLGLIEQVILSTAIIGVHNVWLHGAKQLKSPLHTKRFFGKIVIALEYVINTPSLHRGHHGLGSNGVPEGNYAQTLFIWDVIFGTATFNKGKTPDYYGTSNLVSMAQPWYYQLWWPIFTKKKEITEKLSLR